MQRHRNFVTVISRWDADPTGNDCHCDKTFQHSFGVLIMTIENTDKVDGLGVDAQAQEAVLLISDHLSWHDVGEHFGFLEKKIGSYVSFINSGQLDQALPNAKGLPVRV